MWHVTRDMWHMTRDTWHMTCFGGWTFSQNFSSLALTVCDLWYYEDREKRLTYWLTPIITYEAVYRRAPATTGLLKKHNKEIKSFYLKLHLFLFSSQAYFSSAHAATWNLWSTYPGSPGRRWSTWPAFTLGLTLLHRSITVAYLLKEHLCAKNIAKIAKSFTKNISSAVKVLSCFY